MGKQIKYTDFTLIRIMFLIGAIAMLIFGVVAFFSGLLVDIKNIVNFKHGYEVEAMPVDTVLPHSYSKEEYPCVVYIFTDKDGVEQTARFYKQVSKSEAEKLIDESRTVTLKYRVYLYPLDYKAVLGMGSYLTIIFLIAMLLFLLALLFTYKIGRQDPHHIVELGKKKIEVMVYGNLVQVFNAPTRLSLLVNGNTVEFFDGMVAPKFRLTTEIQTAAGMKTVTLKMGLLFLRLYCEDALLAKKFAGFG